jgi:hypothetical protein
MWTFPLDFRLPDVDAIDVAIVATENDADVVVIDSIAAADGDGREHGGSDVQRRDHVAAIVQVQDVNESFDWKRR